MMMQNLMTCRELLQPDGLWMISEPLMLYNIDAAVQPDDAN
jgi:hypothetical protein